MKMKSFYLTLALMLLSSFVYAQTSFRQAEEGNKIHIIGTSNLHDWELASENVKCKAELYIEDGQITGIKKIVVTMVANTLKSGKSGLDKNAYKTMNVSDDEPLISFIAFDMGPNGEAAGIMKIAGSDEQEMELAYTYEFKDGQLLINSDSEVTFSQFGMKAPSILAGTIKVAEEVQLKVTLVLEEVTKS